MRQAGKRTLRVLLSLCVAMVCAAAMAATANADDVIHAGATYYIDDMVNFGEVNYIRNDDQSSSSVALSGEYQLTWTAYLANFQQHQFTISKFNATGSSSRPLYIGDTNGAKPTGIRVKGGDGSYGQPFEFEVVHGKPVIKQGDRYAIGDAINFGVDDTYIITDNGDHTSGLLTGEKTLTYDEYLSGSNKHAFGLDGSDGSSSNLYLTDDDGSRPYGIEVTGGSGTSLSPFTLAVLRECTASFVGGGAAGDGPRPMTVLSGESITLPDRGFTPPAGKAFSGWLSSVDQIVRQPGDPVTLTEDAPFTAQWSDGMAVDFNSNGGSIVDTQYVLPGACATAPTMPVRNGYKFLCWTRNGSEFDFSTPITGDVTLTALWAMGTNINEGGESGQLPDGWTTSGDVDDYVWTVDTGYLSDETGAHGGDMNFIAKIDSSEGEAWLITPEFDLSGLSSVTLDLWYINRPWGSDVDGFGVYYRVGGGAWEELFSTGEGHDSWTNLTLSLPDGVLPAIVQIGFKATSNYGFGVGLDDVSFDAAVPHVHSWAYAAEGATITATCGGVEEGVCVEPSETLTIAAPADLTADGQPKPATIAISGDKAFAGAYDDAIVYKRGEMVLDGAPTEPGTYTASVTAEGATAEVEYTLTADVAKVLSANLTLGGELGLNFHLSVPEVMAADAKAVMEGPQGRVEAVLAVLSKDNQGRYELSYPVAAIWTDRDVTLTLVDGADEPIALHNSKGERLEGDAMTYSVYRYCQDALFEDSPLDEEWKTKVRATYTYCAYAVRWKYGTALPEGVDALPDVTAASPEVAAHGAVATGAAPEGVEVTGVTLALESDTSLRLYFTCDGAVPKVALDGVEVSPESIGKDNKHFVQVGRIGVKYLGGRHTVSFDGGVYKVELDALSYVYGALWDQDTEPALVDVSRALWAYAAAFAEE